MKTNHLVWALLTFLLPLFPLPSQAQQEQLATIMGLDAKWTNCPISGIEAAAKAGNPNAQVNLAMVLEWGKNSYTPWIPTPGIEKLQPDPEKAVFWYRKAAEKGDAFAQNNLGVMLYYGRGVKTNKEEAVKWLTASAMQGETTAQANLALHFMQIEIGGVASPCYEDAAKWYQRAAEGGDWYSQYDIGRAYEAGLGVVRDRVEALKWYYLSASHGRERAKLAADKLESILTRDQIADAEFRAKSFTVRKRGADDSHSSSSLLTKRTPISSGSAFFITEDGFLVTNEHVVSDATQIRLVTSAGLISAKVVKVDTTNDLALLKADGKFSPVPIAASRAVKLGGTVATVGFPNIGLQGFAPKLAKGEIASLSGAADDARYFQISVPVQPGNSGGALVDEHGNVVGVVSAKLDAATALASSGALPENVNYAVKSSFLLSFLESVPAVSAKLKEPVTADRKFEDVVKSAQDAAVLVLVY
jgi:TPR repeat protein